MLNLRERSKLKLKSPRIEAIDTPRVGDIIQLKEDLTQGARKMRKIVELIPSDDGMIRAAKILLGTKNTLNQSLNLLFPLQCNNKNEDITNVDMRQNNEINNNPNDSDQKPTNQEFVAENKKPTRSSTRKAALHTSMELEYEQE